MEESKIRHFKKILDKIYSQSFCEPSHVYINQDHISKLTDELSNQRRYLNNGMTTLRIYGIEIREAKYIPKDLALFCDKDGKPLGVFKITPP